MHVAYFTERPYRWVDEDEVLTQIGVTRDDFLQAYDDA